MNPSSVDQASRVELTSWKPFPPEKPAFPDLLIDPPDIQQTHHRELTVAHILRFSGTCHHSSVIGDAQRRSNAEEHDIA
jgi:hypothetical protein